jgi:putative ABC transport system substrate-binding protein
MRRREFITLVGGAAVSWPLAAHAQQPERMRRLAVFLNLHRGDPEAQRNLTTLLQGLAAIGWIEGRNLHIDYRWARDEPNSTHASAVELVKLMADVIMASSTDVLAALRQETRAIPIVFVAVSDPVGQGFVESLAHPGGNVTGFAAFDGGQVDRDAERDCPRPFSGSPCFSIRRQRRILDCSCVQ